MTRIVTLSLCYFVVSSSFAATGGPDAYGYIWKDSNEADGPVFNWIDITTIGTQVTGLSDDNIVGPFVMQTNMPFYWYDPKKVWIGSNGYIAFNNVNVASPFPNIPMAGAPNDYVACMMADLNITGAGNPGSCWIYDDVTVTIVSWIDYPFWTSAAPTWTGENSFQVILNKLDSTITVQYQEQTGLSFNGDLLAGIESITGDIGLQHSADTYPPIGYAVRYYAPAVPLIDIIDASVEWNTEENTWGRSMKRFGPQFPLTINVRNTGSVGVADFLSEGEVFTSSGASVVSDSWPIDTLAPGIDTIITYPAQFNPITAGTFRFRGSISGITNELVISNNIRDQEFTVYDTTVFPMQVDWAGPTDDGLGIGWAGGNAGVGVRIIPPYYPAYVTGVTTRISANGLNVGYLLRIYDDDGPGATHGTLLDSIVVPPASATIGDHVHPVTAPFFINDGAVYVEWFMLGDGINIAQDIQPPFSLHSFEVLAGTWADYRDRDIADFHLGLQLNSVPDVDLGCVAFFGLAPGIDVSGPTTVRTWVKNFGNVTMNTFPVNYRFDGGAVVTQNYLGAALLPGDSVLFTFSTQFTPTSETTGDMCAWTSHASDTDHPNDTVCVSIDTFVGIGEHVAGTLSISPLPASDRITVNGLPGEPVRIALFDLGGALIRELRTTGSASITIDARDLAEGTYLLQAIATDRLLAAKVVVAR